MRGVELLEVEAGYGGSRVLRGVTVRARPSRLTAVLGPNGAGKSTLLRVAAGMLPPEKGRVLVEGINPYRVPRSRLARIAAYVSQVPRSRPLLTVLEYVAMSRVLVRGAWRVTSCDLEAAWRALETLNVEHLAERRLDELSGGQRQLVDIAHALARDPRVLLLDEPTSNLDLRRQHELMETLRSLAHRGEKTIIAVLHDVNLALDYADYVVLLSDGRVVAQGEPSEVLEPRILTRVYGVEVARVSVDGVVRVVVRRPCGLNGVEARRV